MEADRCQRVPVRTDRSVRFTGDHDIQFDGTSIRSYPEPDMELLVVSGSFRNSSVFEATVFDWKSPCWTGSRAWDSRRV